MPEGGLAKQWFRAQELADLKVLHCSTKRGINKRAQREGWRRRDTKGQGGGYEYFVEDLPRELRKALIQRLAPKPTPVEVQRPSTDRNGVWARFERLTDRQKAKAAERLSVVRRVKERQRETASDLAVIEVANETGWGRSTVSNWLAQIAGQEPDDWLALLAPHYVGRQKTAECDDDAWDVFKGLYLRLEGPNAEACHRHLLQIAEVRGWKVPAVTTLMRRLRKELSPAAIVYAREGAEAVKRMHPHQERDRSSFHALQAVNADGHRWDIWVKFPDGEIARPCMVVFQDLYSGKILSWRVGRTINSGLVRLAFGDVVDLFGIPSECWLDNGRENASKWITGGTANRYRFKIREEDPEGILTNLGIKVHWTQPYSGQSKPIERAFRDFAQNIAKHPAFAGAYTGNSPVDKPENYRSKAIDLEEFIRVTRAEIVEHNARPGRLSKVCGGTLSFDAAFTRSFTQSAIRKATEEQRRLWLLAAEGVTASARDGSISLMGNRYWADFLHRFRGESVAARFDPDFLHDGLHVYRLDGTYLGHAPVIEPAGFADADAAREHGRQRKRWLRAQKDLLDAERRMSAAMVASLLPEQAPPSGAPEATIVQLARPVHDLRRRPSREVTPELDARREAEIAEFRRPEPAKAAEPLDAAAARFERAMKLELALATGGEVGDGELEWLERYRELPEYRARMRRKQELEGIEQAGA